MRDEIRVISKLVKMKMKTWKTAGKASNKALGRATDLERI